MAFSQEEKEVKSAISRWMWWIVGIVLVLSLIGACWNNASKVLDVDKGISSYENFYQIYEQADQICNDIHVMQSADSISGGFTKNERIMGLENKLNDVIRDYNAQSGAWTKSMWKSGDLPQTLTRRNFQCN